VKGEPSANFADATTYTAWVREVDNPEESWILIASWRRPVGMNYLSGWFSFAENFSENNGNLVRTCHYGRQWAHSTDGKWYESAKTSA